MATPPSGPMPFDERPSHTRVVDWRSRCATQKAPWSSSRLSPSSSSHGCAAAPAASSPSTSVCAAVAPSAAARSSSRSRRLPAAMICWKRLSRSSVGMRSRSSHRASKSRAESSSSVEEELRFAAAERARCGGARCDGRSEAALLAGRSEAALLTTGRAGRSAAALLAPGRLLWKSPIDGRWRLLAAEVA